MAQYCILYKACDIHSYQYQKRFPDISIRESFLTDFSSRYNTQAYTAEFTYNCQGTTSFTAMSIIFDALQSALIEETEFQNEQFALIDPAGAVGARLNQ